MGYPDNIREQVSAELREAHRKRKDALSQEREEWLADVRYSEGTPSMYPDPTRYKAPCGCVWEKRYGRDDEGYPITGKWVHNCETHYECD